MGGEARFMERVETEERRNVRSCRKSELGEGTF